MLLVALACGTAGASAEAQRPWLFVSDIHLNPADRSAKPVAIGRDTNLALLDSALAEMKRVDPNPPVVVIGGDFLGHRFDYRSATATMQQIAARFGRAFPQAQFLPVLGNEDAGCADYGFAPDSAFARTVAAAWAPLADRGGASPAFARTFATGFYSARLPLAGTNAVVTDDVFWSPFYHRCGGRSANEPTQLIAQLRTALQASNERHWIIAHIPPGIDAYSSTQLGRGLVVVPLLKAEPQAAFLALVADPANHVSLVLSAHAHRFAYRIAGSSEHPVPILLIPALSPIFRNAPAFLTVEVDPSGALRAAEVHAFLDGRWQDVGGTRSLGLSDVRGASLVRLQERIADDARVRATFERLYVTGGDAEIDARNWRAYWCAAANFTPDSYRTCTGAGGIGLVTGRALALAALLGTVGLIGLALAARRFVRRQP